jgi:hypothetical protein
MLNIKLAPPKDKYVGSDSKRKIFLDYSRRFNVQFRIGRKGASTLLVLVLVMHWLLPPVQTACSVALNIKRATRLRKSLVEVMPLADRRHSNPRHPVICLVRVCQIIHIYKKNIRMNSLTSILNAPLMVRSWTDRKTTTRQFRRLRRDLKTLKVKNKQTKSVSATVNLQCETCTMFDRSYTAIRPASWSSGRSFWLLIMRSRDFSLKGKIPMVTMVWVV